MIRKLKRFVFPSLCLQCKEETEDQLLCSGCLTLLDFLPSKEKAHHLETMSVFERRGPASDLIKHFRNRYCPGLAKSLAALMVVQWDHLKWPLPDLIVPVPQSLAHRFLRGYNPSLLLGREIGGLLSRPVKQLLVRRLGDFSQEGLAIEQRRLMNKRAFKWKKLDDLSGKTILLIDDFHVTGTTLKRCAEVLREGFPKKIYALTFCSSEASC